MTWFLKTPRAHLSMLFNILTGFWNGSPSNHVILWTISLLIKASFRNSKCKNKSWTSHHQHTNVVYLGQSTKLFSLYTFFKFRQLCVSFKKNVAQTATKCGDSLSVFTKVWAENNYIHLRKWTSQVQSPDTKRTTYCKKIGVHGNKGPEKPPCLAPIILYIIYLFITRPFWVFLYDDWTGLVNIRESM